MRISRLGITAAVAACLASSTAQAGMLFDGPVSAKVVAFTASARADLATAEAVISSGFASGRIDSTGVIDDVPAGQFSLTITELDANTRQIDVSWSFPQAIIAPGTTFLSEPFVQLAFEFGAPNPVLDPLLADPDSVVEVLSQSGTLTDVFGGSFDVGVFIFLGRDNGGLSGYNAFVLPDGSGGLLDISNAGWNGLSSSAVYRVVPEPSAIALLALGGLAAARRRR